MLQKQLQLDTTFVPEIQRVNDSHIMDHMLEQGTFSKTDICQINYCRLYLQAVTVSDISNATGTHLAPGIRTGDPTLWSSVTRYHKTNQSRPNSTSWRLWSKSMELFFTEDKLFVPLRQWMIPPSRQRRLWPVYYNPIINSMFFRQNAQFDRHDALDKYFLFQSTSSQPTLPETADFCPRNQPWLVSNCILFLLPDTSVTSPFLLLFLLFSS
jgi:hypothetical protein